MNEQAQTNTPTRETLSGIEKHIQCRLTRPLREFHLVFRDKGLVLRGHVNTYYAKQLAQHTVMAGNLPICGNEMEVDRPERGLSSRTLQHGCTTAAVLWFFSERSGFPVISAVFAARSP